MLGRARSDRAGRLRGDRGDLRRKDNDCDTLVDEELTAPAATLAAGVCAGQVKVCKGADGWSEPDLAGLAGYEATEASCDGRTTTATRSSTRA